MHSCVLLNFLGAGYISHSLKKIFQIAIVTLCVFVFAWGLHYKLSLYETSSTNALPVVKLLSGRSDVTLEDSTPISKPRLDQVSAVLVIGLLVCLANDQKVLTYRSFLSAYPRFGRSLELAHLSRFSFRPPPALA